jgi:hypothetical protein
MTATADAQEFSVPMVATEKGPFRYVDSWEGIVPSADDANDVMRDWLNNHGWAENEN